MFEAPESEEELEEQSSAFFITDAPKPEPKISSKRQSRDSQYNRKNNILIKTN